MTAATATGALSLSGTSPARANITSAGSLSLGASTAARADATSVAASVDLGGATSASGWSGNAQLALGASGVDIAAASGGGTLTLDSIVMAYANGAVSFAVAEAPSRGRLTLVATAPSKTAASGAAVIAFGAAVRSPAFGNAALDLDSMAVQQMASAFLDFSSSFGAFQSDGGGAYLLLSVPAVSSSSSGDASGTAFFELTASSNARTHDNAVGSGTLELGAGASGRQTTLASAAAALVFGLVTNAWWSPPIGTPVTRWIFHELASAQRITLPRNPDQAASPLPQRHIRWARGVSSASGMGARGFAEMPQTTKWQFGGSISTQAHHDLLVDWCQRPGLIWVTDHLGRTFEVLFTGIEITERGVTPASKARFRYVAKAELLREVD